MTPSGPPRPARRSLARWLAVMVAVGAVAVLHGVQCEAGMSAPLMAPPVVTHAVHDKAQADAAAAALSAGRSAAAGAATLAHPHQAPTSGAGAGACLLLLTAAGLALAVLARHRGYMWTPAAVRACVRRRPPRRLSPRLAQLCLLRT